MRLAAVVGAGLVLLSGCATSSSSVTACLITHKPARSKTPIAWHLVDVTLLRPLRRHARASVTSVDPEQASSFWTPRDPASLLPGQLALGPTAPGQRPRPPFMIVRVKGEGKTPGFVVTDAKDDRYLFKLDVAGSPELLTGAEVVSSKLLYALGYHVPSYEIVEVAADEFAPSPRVSRHELDELLAGRIRQGRVRVSASRWLEGELLGHWSFKRYQSCPAVRALRVAYAWLHNTDAKDHNTLMAWSGDRAIGYLIDFGSSLGASASRGAKTPCQGWVFDVDLAESLTELLTLGLHEGGCDPRERPESPAVGLFSPRLEPHRWKPYMPNVAFDAMTESDARWMASQIARLSPMQLAEAVSAGRYRDPADANRIVEILEARRRAILEAYLR